MIVHEIAHQWFGNAVTEGDWDDVWLSEGFATYFTHLFVEHAEGRDAFVAGLRADRDQIRAFDLKNPGYRIVHDNLADMKQVTTGAGTYQKGAWTLHMLRGVVGDEAFWSGIREYYRLYRDKNASTADFRRVMEEASGSDLGWFFDQWLTRGGMLKVEGPVVLGRGGARAAPRPRAGAGGRALPHAGRGGDRGRGRDRAAAPSGSSCASAGRPSRSRSIGSRAPWCSTPATSSSWTPRSPAPTRPASPCEPRAPASFSSLSWWPSRGPRLPQPPRGCRRTGAP